MYGISFLSFDAARGEIATTLARIYLEHKSDFNKKRKMMLQNIGSLKKKLKRIGITNLGGALSITEGHSR